MFHPLPLYIGLRYTRAKRRNHFISFISLTSMLGIALGVTALITVLSVMNGFERELRHRMLGMAPHVEVLAYGSSMPDWETVAEKVRQQPLVTGVAPFVQGQAMVSHRQNVFGVMLQGVLPEQEDAVSNVREKIQFGDFAELQPGKFRVILGSELARALRVRTGDKITVVVPQANVTPVGVLPRMKRMEVAGIFEMGLYEFDSGLALLHLEDAAKLLRLPEGDAHGLNVKMSDMFRAPRLAKTLQSEVLDGYYAFDWTYRHANFFQAIKMEKTVMFVILTLIVAVAAFNIVSTLVMVVTDKEADIAILRTLGMSPRGIMGVFIVQGCVIGVFGALLGILGGVSLALNIETLVPAIEQTFGVEFLSSEVYYISDVPSDLRWPDVFIIGGVSFAISLLATLYPAWRAARTQPAEALRYE